MSFSATGRRSVGGSSSGAAGVQWNGGFGLGAGSTGRTMVARQLIELQGMEIEDPAARYGNPGFRVKEGLFEIGKATIDGGLNSVQVIPIIGDMDRVELTHVSFRLWTAQPAALRGGIYVAEPVNGVPVQFAELVPSDFDYSSLDYAGSRGLATIRLALNPMFRAITAAWWVPSVPQAGIGFEASLWGMPRWYRKNGAQEV